VLSQILTHKLLHPSIREQGGAYGAGATANALGGSFGMYTYRDPNPLRSVGVMQEAGRWAVERIAAGGDDVTKQINEAKMLIFQGVDAPMSVADMGMKKFLYGIDENMEKERRL
jgi:Zn-dependent M16 (insulinase) family peptidase